MVAARLMLRLVGLGRCAVARVAGVRGRALRRAVVATSGVRGRAVHAVGLAVARLSVIVRRTLLALGSAKSGGRRRRSDSENTGLGPVLLRRAAVRRLLLRRRLRRTATAQAAQVVAPVAVARHRRGSRGRAARHRRRRGPVALSNADRANSTRLDGALPALRRSRSRLRGVKVCSLLSIVQRVGHRLRQVVRLRKRTWGRRRRWRHRILAMRQGGRDRGAPRRRLGRRRSLWLLLGRIQRLRRRWQRRKTVVTGLLLLLRRNLRLHMRGLWLMLRVVRRLMLLLLLLLNEQLIAGIVATVGVLWRSRGKRRWLRRRRGLCRLHVPRHISASGRWRQVVLRRRSGWHRRRTCRWRYR